MMFVGIHHIPPSVSICPYNFKVYQLTVEIYFQMGILMGENEKIDQNTTSLESKHSKNTEKQKKV